ncbi:MAG: hypothetical protein JXQ83_14510, partial [Candidatus Glassbacteria bacterium]|nr:hypothetical protein [Candidatus Glassbacteria bacterium]
MRRKILPLLISTTVLAAAALTSSRTPGGIDAAYRGDLNEDGRIDIFDLVGLVRLIFTQEFGSERLRRLANVDDSADGKVSLADLMSLVEVFTGRQPRQAVVFSSAVAGVWAVGDGEKVFRDDLDHRCRESNSIWDGEVIRLAGLYNEVLAFQVIVSAGLEGASEVEIAVEPPLHAETSRAIGAPGSSPYSPAGGVELFSEHYLHVQNPTSPLWFYGSPASAPERMTGWIPDALIPQEAMSGRGGFPLEVPAGCNQGFWVDLYLPRDTLYEAGVYLGRVTVLEQGWEVASIPLEINLLPHYLPDENHSNVWLYHDSVEPYYPDLSAGQLESMLKHEAHRHRIDLVGGFRAHYTGFDPQVMDAYKPYLDGSAFTEAAGYQGPGQGEGEHIFPIGMYGSSVLGDTKEQVQAQSDLWVDWF